MAGFFAVLTAATGVGDDLVAAVAAELGAATPNRLSPGAVELPLDARPEVLPQLPGVDLNLVPAAGRRKRLLIADMDSTIIGVECIDELADYAGVKREVAQITDRAMRGELDFEGALEARVALLRGLPVSALETCYAERVRLNPGAEALVRGMNAAGARTALVSGGFTFFSERVAAAAGFASHQANRLDVGPDGRLTGRVQYPILGRAAKAEALAAICAELGCDAADAIAVGDGANDLAMVEAAGLGVAYHARPALAQAADAVLDHSDLTALLALQGLRP